MRGYDELDFGIRLCRNIPELMKVLDAEVRFEFVRSLARHPKNVGDLADELGLRQSCASQHLRPMRQAGIVLYDQAKKDHCYRLSDRVSAAIEHGVIYLSVPSQDGDVLSIRTHVPCLSIPRQPTFWPWAETIRFRNGQA